MERLERRPDCYWGRERWICNLTDEDEAGAGREEQPDGLAG